MLIKVNGVTKKLGLKKVLNNITINLDKSSITGLIGMNGAGKSTLLRTICGVYKPDCGCVTLNDKIVYENPSVKSKIFFVPDYPYFFNNATLESMACIYSKVYPKWNNNTFTNLISLLSIDKKSKIVHMSKGLQRQCALILALSSGAKCLLLDEIFDGLDPVIRNLVKKLLIDEITVNETSILISSHNLRELEDICDHIELVNNGKLVLEDDINELKSNLHKIQVAYKEDYTEELHNKLHIINAAKAGSVYTYIIKGEQEKIFNELNKFNPIFLDDIPLSLEEIFITEMEDRGYEYEI